MTSRSLARALVLSSTLAVFGWAFIGGCGGHPLGLPHPSGSAGKGAAGSSATGSAGSSPTGTGPGMAGYAVSGVGGATTSGAAGATTSGAAGDTSVGFAGGVGTGSGGAIVGSAGGGGSTETCMQAQAQYDGLHAKLAYALGASGCNVDLDCVAVPDPGACGAGCPDTALPASVVMMFVSELASDATICDGVCPPRPALFCPANPALCRGGRCVLSSNVGAGGTTGGTGSAGTSGGTAGGPGCGPCVVPVCKPGYVPEVDPSISCCPICRPMNCNATLCAQPICPAGTHAEVPTGQCCPVCVMGFSQDCNTAEAQYSMQRQAFLGKYGSIPCKVDSECRLVYEQNSCVFNCGEALPVSTAGFFETNIAPLAMACDAACPPIAPPPCLAQVAVCSNGSCTTVPANGLQ
jgi:hypothetical protein